MGALHNAMRSKFVVLWDTWAWESPSWSNEASVLMSGQSIAGVAEICHDDLSKITINRLE